MTLVVEYKLLTLCEVQVQNKMKAALAQSLQILKGLTGSGVKWAVAQLGSLPAAR